MRVDLRVGWIAREFTAISVCVSRATRHAEFRRSRATWRALHARESAAWHRAVPKRNDTRSAANESKGKTLSRGERRIPSGVESRDEPGIIGDRASARSRTAVRPCTPVLIGGAPRTSSRLRAHASLQAKLMRVPARAVVSDPTRGRESESAPSRPRKLPARLIQHERRAIFSTSQKAPVKNKW